jgi:hypothetical protein
MRSQSSHNSEVQNFWKLLAIYFATTLVIFWLHPATALKKNLYSVFILNEESLEW